MPNPNIQFPVLRRLVVKEYGLFPGKEGTGLDHTFEPGVTVIPGINGLGKTTLLNIIYRLLVGPFDPFKDEEGIQLTQTRLKKLDFFNYFSKRDRGASTKASASGEFTFGQKKLLVTRRLDNLAITGLSVDQVDVPATQGVDREDAIWGLSGCGSQYDFHLIVRTLLFFMEQKTPVIWDAQAQAEVFRILFLTAIDAAEFSKIAYEIQRLDSRSRNMHSELTRYRRQLLRMQVQTSTAPNVTRQAEEKESRLQVVETDLSRLDQLTSDLERARDEGRQKLDGLKLDLEESTRALEHLHQEYFASLFPRLPETVKNVLSNLVGDNGCIVCGSRQSGLAAQFQALAADGSCPICRSPKEQHEQSLVVAHFGSESIRNANSRVAALKRNVSEVEESLGATNSRYNSVLRDQVERQTERRQLRSDIEALRGMLPPSPDELLRTENYVKFTETEIGNLRREIKDLVTDYTGRLGALRAVIDDVKGNLASFFAEYAGSFLAETCSLTFSPQKILIGQAVERIEFPTFAVQMTSAVSPSTGTTRTEFNDVSESQKEFIDLAFRMAILKAYAVVSGSTREAMIVIETPESSLDSVFIANAGQMLRNWCNASSGGRNSVIATCNLNRENMIAALLGLHSEPEPSTEEIHKRILNLLEVAAQNAALQKHREHYEKEFLNATTPGGANG